MSWICLSQIKLCYVMLSYVNCLIIIITVCVYAKYSEYGKCPKISHTKISAKMEYANSVVPDQTAPWCSLIRIYNVCHSTKYLRNNPIKVTLGHTGME